MLGTKIRTIVIALVAAFSFATASVAPAVSHAQIYDEHAKEMRCKTMQQEYKHFMDEVASANKAGNTSEVMYWLHKATAIASQASGEGCKWAGLERPPESPTALAETPVGATQGTEAALPPVQSITVTPARATAP